MQSFEVPLTAQPQRIQIALNGVTYTLVVTWNDPSSAWVMDMLDAEGNQIIGALPLVPGTDLLGQFEYMEFGGQLQVQSDTDLNRAPDFTSLGTTSHLYFVIP